MRSGFSIGSELCKDKAWCAATADDMAVDQTPTEVPQTTEKPETQKDGGSDWRVHPLAGAANSLIPPKIWQIFLPKQPSAGDSSTADPESLSDTPSWIAMNPDYS